MKLAAALRYGGLDRGLEQTCQLCHGTEHETDAEKAERLELRRRWGCDEELPHPIIEGDCPICPEKSPRAKCPECKGTGQVEYRRCPYALVTDDVWAVMQSAAFLERGLLPAEGGWVDQSQPWAQAITLLLNEKGTYEQKARDAAEKKARSQANKGSGGRRRRRR